MLRIDQLSVQDQAVHQSWMELALEEARKASELGEVPIGAVIVQDGQVLAQSHNLREIDQSATAHAELLAIQAANQKTQTWRLDQATLYVTLEPCAMCAGAIVQARLKEVVYATQDPKGGCAGSLMNLLEESRFNHQAQVIHGVCQAEASQQLKDFFRTLRQEKKAQKLQARQAILDAQASAEE